MNDNITIKDIREILALVGRNPTPGSTSLLDSTIGRDVVVRSTQSGVWMGRLIAANGHDVRLYGARRLWQWTGATECSGLAVFGPGGGKIGPAVSVVVHDAAEVLEATEAAMGRLAAVPVWTV